MTTIIVSIAIIVALLFLAAVVLSAVRGVYAAEKAAAELEARQSAAHDRIPAA